MSRNFGISFEKLSDRTDLGAKHPSGPRHSAGAHADSNVIKFQSPGGAAPSGRRSDSRASQPALFLREPALKRGPIAQALIDIFAVAVVGFLAGLAGLAVAIPFFVAGLLLFWN